MNETGSPMPPRGEPACGFDNEYCKLSMEFIIGMGFLILMAFILAWFAVRFVHIYSYIHIKPLLSIFMKGNEVTLTGQNQPFKC